jgi:hypothetical protein
MHSCLYALLVGVQQDTHLQHVLHHSTAHTNNQPQQQCQQQPVCLLVFNLFALEAYHLAEALGSACAAAHPYAIPYSMPSTFEQQFQQQEPALYQQLQEAVGNRQGLVSWSEVRTG